MPWFYCDDCGESIKKPKVLAHTSRCSARSFTCIDCSATFDQWSVQGHTRCVTEKEKYVEGATKPGGYAATGFVKNSREDCGDVEIVGEEHLSTSPPWRCRLCNQSCTDRNGLLMHAKGKKHRRKASREEQVKRGIAIGLAILDEQNNRVGFKRFRRHFIRKCAKQGVKLLGEGDALGMMHKVPNVEIGQKHISLRAPTNAST